MRLCFTIILCVLIFKSGAQNKEIDSLKTVLPTLKGIAKIDANNSLSHQFSYYWIHSDSAIKYADLAFKDASAINYKKGSAIALFNKANVEGRLLGHPQEMETLAKRAINILSGTKEVSAAIWAHYYLSIAYSILGKYTEAYEQSIKAKELALISKDKNLLGWVEESTGFIFFKKGELWRAFPYLYDAQKIGRETNDSLLLSLSFALIARSFSAVEDYAKAVYYYHQSFQYAVPFIYLWSHVQEMGYAHLKLRNYDSAMYFHHYNEKLLKSVTSDLKVSKKFASYKNYTTEILLAKKHYDTVLHQMLPVVTRLKTSGDVYPYMNALLSIAKAYEGKRAYASSLSYGRELYRTAQGISNNHWLNSANDLLSSVFTKMNMPDSAFYYYRHYVSLRDSMQTIQFANRTALYLAASEAENRIRILEQDKTLNQQQLFINTKELQKQSQLKNAFIIGSILLVAISLLFFRNIILKRKNEQLQNKQVQTDLKRKALELEMQALRAQMNPHFIFNCLSAIDNLVQTRQTEKATVCLSRFAKLIRSVLESSKNNLVPFYKDFETLQLYLELEQFRCNNKFTYHIYADNRLMEGGFKVPPLIIQPFIENAIQHGLLNKEANDRSLVINATLETDHIVYTIEDNGIGRKLASAIKTTNNPGHTSYGIDITKERIQLHNKNGIDTDLVITDIEDAGAVKGTKATVKIHF